MQQQPLDYERHRSDEHRRTRRQSGRAVVVLWVLWAGAVVFAVASSSDFSPLQWPAATAAAFLTFLAVLLTLVHWVVVVPALWYAKRQARSRH